MCLCIYSVQFNSKEYMIVQYKMESIVTILIPFFRRDDSTLLGCNEPNRDDDKLLGKQRRSKFPKQQRSGFFFIKLTYTVEYLKIQYIYVYLHMCRLYMYGCIMPPF